MADAISVSEALIPGAPDKTLTFETGKLAGQADGAVVVQHRRHRRPRHRHRRQVGVREGIDFFPLTVDIEERMYAAGRSPARSSAVRAGPPTRPSSPAA